MSRHISETGRNFATVLTMTPFTGMNHAILGVSAALNPKLSFEVRPSVSKDLVDAFKSAVRRGGADDREVSALISAASQQLEDRFAFISELREMYLPVVIINPGSSPKRNLQSLAFKQALKRGFLLGFNYPGAGRDRFDLTVVNPSEEWQPDHPSPALAVGAVANLITPARLAGARRQWEPTLRCGQRRLVALLIGGDVGSKNRKHYRPFTLAHARETIDLARAATLAADADLVITTSRRTPSASVHLLEQAVAAWDQGPGRRAPWLYVARRDQGENPYLGFLATADAIIVTADSLSMLSEAVDSDRPVFTIRLPGLLRREHELLYQHLLRHRHITELPAPLQFGQGRPIRSAETIAREVLARMAPDRLAEVA